MQAVMDVGGPDAGHEQEELKGQEVHGDEEQQHCIRQRLHHAMARLVLMVADMTDRG